MRWIFCLGGAAAAAAAGWLAVSIGADSPDAARALPASFVTESGASPAPPHTAKPPSPAKSVRYGRDVRPILSDRCFLCHGPDRDKRKGDLRLDSFEDATTPRGDKPPAIVPGDLESSELWRRVTSDDPEVRMPPPECNKRPLTDDERETIRAWIDGGAAYEPHWAFQVPHKPEPPSMPGDDWCRNPIDRFVLSELAGAGLAPSPEADPETLLRRVFLDLTGLPPTPEEVEAYLADPAPDRYERLVDRLFTEEPYRTRYAERMTAPWLDQARYADTCGIHMDAGRSIWPWRDWVLEAYRTNMPFDEFVIEQLAGDLLPDATDAQKIASGFNRNHVTTDEGGVIAEEYLIEYAVDRVNTTGSVFLGLTVGCARCHDHKFDPVTQDDYYSLIAFFNSIEEPGLYSQLPDPKRAFEPFMEAPSPEQAATRSALETQVAALAAERDAPNPEEDGQRHAFLTGLAESAGVRWVLPGAGLAVESAESSGGAALALQDDGSLLAGGANPDRDITTISLATDATGLRLLSLEALTDPSLPEGRVGRAPNGNAVLAAVEAEAVSVADPTQRHPIRFTWAWADVEQPNGDFRVTNALDPDASRGWAVGAHFDPEGQPRGRTALFLADERFGFEGGTRVVVRLRYDSVYAQHSFGRVRLGLGAIGEEGLARLPLAAGGYYRLAQFSTGDRETVFDTAFGPEQSAGLDLTAKIDDKMWQLDLAIQDGATARLTDGVGVDYVAREVFAPTERPLDLSLGSDDGIRLFVNGAEAFAKRADRSLAPDQDRTTIQLARARNIVLYKIVNTGGVSGIYSRPIESEAVLPHDIVGMLLPEPARRADIVAAADEAWRTRFSPRYREISDQIAAHNEAIAALNAQIPRTMVMKEREMPRDTFVLTRGQYDHPDETRPVERAVPRVLGRLADDGPKTRLGLARWIMSDEDPLVARVTANRLWEMLFGRGIVRTSEDFGYQGEWPTHPELLDWLAVEFRDCAWDVQHMLRLILTSSTYRQTARVRPDAKEADPDNRLLAYYPRQRLTAEQIRDQALYVGGLLVERAGGPSVKPYQPEGLWQEVAMIQSNTRIYERGMGDELWRRSIYTYWKRAAPPPAMLTFDAPTREFCTIRRMSTNTPLQALVLWNDEQFVEAARAAATRVMLLAEGDEDRLALLYRLCTGASLDEPRLAALAEALLAFRARYEASAQDAAALVTKGESPVPGGLDQQELAAWTMLASAVMSSDATIVKN